MPSYVSFPHIAALAEHAASLLAKACHDAVASRNACRIAISGGTTPIALFRLLATATWAHRLPWEKTTIFWADERCVPPHDPQSNYGVAKRELLDHIPARFQRMQGELPPAQAAAAYEQTLREEFCLAPGALPRFDLVLLGMGADGHTASLFPGTTALAERERLAVANHVPKLETWRITLTLPVLNNARACVFLVAGQDKQPALAQILASKDEADTSALPAGMVRPDAGDLVWLVDAAAAGTTAA